MEFAILLVLGLTVVIVATVMATRAVPRETGPPPSLTDLLDPYVGRDRGQERRPTRSSK
jgi:hypothetical protein